MWVSQNWCFLWFFFGSFVLSYTGLFSFYLILYTVVINNILDACMDSNKRERKGVDCMVR